MVFVHARNATVKTATALRDMAASNGDLPLFAAEQTTQFGLAEKQVCFKLDSTHWYPDYIFHITVLFLSGVEVQKQASERLVW